MVDCYRKDCPVLEHGEGACRVRMAYDKCPNSLGDEDDEMQLPSARTLHEQEPNGLYSDGEG